MSLEPREAGNGARLGLRLAVDTSRNLRDTESGAYSWYMERTISTGLSGPLGGTRTRKRVDRTTIQILPRVYPELSPGSICRVTLTSKMENKQATFTINREDDMDHVLTSIEISQEVRPRRTVSLTANPNEIDLLQDELEITGRDYSFEETLREVIELLE
jgi:hypothetical protein